MKAYRYRNNCETIEEIEIVSITEKMYKYVLVKGWGITSGRRMDSNYYVSDSFEDTRRYALEYLDRKYNEAKAKMEYARVASEKIFAMEASDVKKEEVI